MTLDSNEKESIQAISGGILSSFKKQKQFYKYKKNSLKQMWGGLS